MSQLYDFIIVGAGAAGLACAQELRKQGKNLLLLEGRDRIGGRVLTLQRPGSVPCELGAEFFHGRPSGPLLAAMGHGTAFYGVSDRHAFFRGSKHRELRGFWEDIQSITKSIPGQKDQTVSDFLDGRRGLSKQKRDLLRAYVEGFHAADTRRMSALSLALEEGKDGDESLNGQEQFRSLGGYLPILQNWLRADPGLEDCVRYHSVLKQIDGRKKGFSLRCRSALSGEESEFRCRRLVLTLPVGVLKAPKESGGVEWIGGMPKELAVSLPFLQMGQVQRLVFRFRTRFWEKYFDEEPSFFHNGPGAYFPTWWTLAPLRTSSLVAWQGGPKAQEMALWTKEQKVHAALKTLGEMFGLPARELSESVEACDTHDWANDPFSLGAYSYVGVNGLRAARALGKPIEGRLLVAGEATVSNGGRGTVPGAMESGIRAARAFLKNGN